MIHANDMFKSQCYGNPTALHHLILALAASELLWQHAATTKTM